MEHLARIMIGSDDVEEMVNLTDYNFGDEETSASIKVLTVEEKLIVAQEKRGKKIPDSIKQRELIIQAHARGHYGEKAMYHFIDKEGYWWPDLRKHIQEEIASCGECRKYTVVKHGYHPSRSVTSFQPGDHYQIDLAEFVTSPDGYTYCLVCVDVFTGFIMLKPLLNKGAATVARALWEIFCTIGIPKVLQSDNGREFNNQLLKELNNMIGVEQRFISEYNPRADGKVERCVRTIKDTVMKLMHGANIYWPLHLPFVQYAYNDKLQELTGATPFTLMYARTPNLPVNYDDKDGLLSIDKQEWRKKQDDIVSLIYPCVAERVNSKQHKYREKLDQRRAMILRKDLPTGTIVMIKDPQYLLNKAGKPSHAPMYIGPYTIVDKKSRSTYQLKDDTGELLQRHVPIDQMKVISTPDNIPAQAPEHDPDTEVFVMEEVLDHRERGGKIEYRIKWKGYPVSQASWIEDSRVNDTNIIDKYFKSLTQPKQDKRTRSRK
jgi:transposase InsO family protein